MGVAGEESAEIDVEIQVIDQLAGAFQLVFDRGGPNATIAAEVRIMGENAALDDDRSQLEREADDVERPMAGPAGITTGAIADPGGEGEVGAGSEEPEDKVGVAPRMKRA